MVLSVMLGALLGALIVTVLLGALNLERLTVIVIAIFLLLVGLGVTYGEGLG
jgi:hypothetical protein